MTIAEKEARAQVVKLAIDAQKKAAHFRCFEKHCGNCQFLDDYCEDFGGTYCFCSNPKNEWEGARPGESYTWTIEEPSCSVCRHWKRKVELW